MQSTVSYKWHNGALSEKMMLQIFTDFSSEALTAADLGPSSAQGCFRTRDAAQTAAAVDDSCPHCPDSVPGSLRSHLFFLKSVPLWPVVSLAVSKTSYFTVTDNTLKASINAGESVERREPSYTIGGNVN